ncbi:unnamed protein product [Arctogadus glacialis]
MVSTDRVHLGYTSGTPRVHLGSSAALLKGPGGGLNPALGVEEEEAGRPGGRARQPRGLLHQRRGRVEEPRPVQDQGPPALIQTTHSFLYLKPKTGGVDYLINLDKGQRCARWRGLAVRERLGPKSTADAAREKVERPNMR